jgi:hypothetical protein
LVICSDIGKEGSAHKPGNGLALPLGRIVVAKNKRLSPSKPASGKEIFRQRRASRVAIVGRHSGWWVPSLKVNRQKKAVFSPSCERVVFQSQQWRVFRDAMVTKVGVLSPGQVKWSCRLHKMKAA